MCLCATYVSPWRLRFHIMFSTAFQAWDMTRLLQAPFKAGLKNCLRFQILLFLAYTSLNLKSTHECCLIYKLCYIFDERRLLLEALHPMSTGSWVGITINEDIIDLFSCFFRREFETRQAGSLLDRLWRISNLNLSSRQTKITTYSKPFQEFDL